MPLLQTKASPKRDQGAPAARPGVPVLAAVLRLLEASPETLGEAYQLRRALADTSPESNRDYCRIMARVVERLGMCDAPSLRSLEWRHCGHDDPYYDQWGIVQCRQCIPPITRHEPGRFLRELDLDACPVCLGDGEVLVKLLHYEDYRRCEMRACPECDPWKE